jgi:hypothetical protein
LGNRIFAAWKTASWKFWCDRWVVRRSRSIDLPSKTSDKQLPAPLLRRQLRWTFRRSHANLSQ